MNVHTETAPERVAVSNHAAMQTLWLLRIGYTVLPILSGYDKYWKWLTSDWGHYLSKSFADASPWNVATTMKVVGAVEIAAGIIVFFAPRIGAPIVAIWLAVIIINLIMLGGYGDVALRDVGLIFGALALTRLAWGQPIKLIGFGTKHN